MASYLFTTASYLSFDWLIEVIHGVPQIIHQLPFDHEVSPELAELDLSQTFDRLIIGPSQFSWAMNQAFTEALTTIGVLNAHERVFPSGIPIRS